MTPVKFDGSDMADAGNVEPPDEWVAAGPSSVVQTTNGRVTVYSRTGQLMASTTTWAFFGVYAPLVDSDPRVIYDSAHGRWVASELVYYQDSSPFLIGFIYLAVSATSDPLGAWTVSDYFYGDHLPDYPGLASSSTKIVVTANEYDLSGFVGASILAVDWSTILAGNDSGWLTSPDANLFAIRPARISGPATGTIFFVAEGAGGHVMYGLMTGVASTVSTGGFVDLTSGGTALGAFATPPAPHQTGGDTIDDAVDDRPTDAVAYGSQLYFISTYPHNPASGVVDTVRVTRLVTTAPGSPTVGSDQLIETDGVDTYMGGIGVSNGGTPFLTYTTSSPGTNPAAHYATYVSDVLGTEFDLASSDDAYGGERWGDYAGVSADPVGTGAVWLTGATAADDTSWRTHVARVVLDTVAPAAPGAPKVSLIAPSTITFDYIPVKITWTAGSDSGSGVRGYGTDVNEGGNGFLSPGFTTATSLTRNAIFTDTYQYKVWAIDWAGNESSQAIGTTFNVKDYFSPSLSKSGSWHSTTSSSYLDGSAVYASTAGASATFSFTGRAIGFLSLKASSRGSVKVYIDGSLKATVSLYSSSTKVHQLVYQYNFPSSGSHKIKLVVVGTKSHPRVDVDGFVVIK